jgi:ethanolamine utilization cobalamin adenosyltransferase
MNIKLNRLKTTLKENEIEAMSVLIKKLITNGRYGMSIRLYILTMRGR